jgi:hypothetical protein
MRGAPLRPVSMVASGGAQSLAIDEGRLFGWGTGTVGQLGLKSDIQVQETPIAVALPLGADKKPQEVAACYAGMVSSACLTAAGDCCMWGDNSQGRLGLDSGKGKGGGGGGVVELPPSALVAPLVAQNSHNVIQRGGQRRHGHLGTVERQTRRVNESHIGRKVERARFAK